MPKTLFYLILCSVFTTIAFGQRTRTLNIILYDATTGQFVNDNSIKLEILSSHFGFGTEHSCSAGICSITYPVDQLLKYRIVSDKYFTTPNVLEYNVANTNTNTTSIILHSITENDIIIKGRIKDPNGNYLNNCKIQIDMEKMTSYQTTTTDTLGFFQIIFRNSANQIIGTNYTISVISPNFKISEQKLVVQNSRIIDLGNISLQSRPIPLKTGYIKFNGPASSLAELVVLSKWFFISEVKTGTGLFSLTSKSDSIPEKASFLLNCKGCLFDSTYIGISRIIDTICYMDLPLRYSLPSISFVITGGISNIFNNNMQKSISPFVKIGISKLFVIRNHWFSIAATLSLLQQDIASKSNYQTLPGNEGTVINDFKLSYLPSLEFDYYFKEPLPRKTCMFTGITFSRRHQSFQNISSDKQIQEKIQNINFYSPGVCGGVYFIINKSLSVRTFADIEYFNIRNIRYVFNYFGRADQIITKSSGIQINAAASIFFNL